MTDIEILLLVLARRGHLRADEARAIHTEVLELADRRDAEVQEIVEEAFNDARFSEQGWGKD